MSDRQKLVDRYLRTADAGTISLVILIAVTAYFFPIEDGDLDGVTALALLPVLIVFAYSLTYLFIRRRADEFTLSLWHSGVTASFLTFILWGVFGGIIIGAIQGWNENLGENTIDPTVFIEQFSGVFCLAAFFAALQVKRLRG